MFWLNNDDMTKKKHKSTGAISDSNCSILDIVNLIAIVVCGIYYTIL
jgi:hypothetical protein